MINNSFIFKNKSSSEMGIHLSNPIRITPAAPNVVERFVPARNGVLHYWDGSYASRTIYAECFTMGTDVHALISRINAWLLEDVEYHEFSDSTDDIHFMLARAVRGVDEQIKANTLNPFILEFDARPERFLTVGKVEMPLTSGTITNPTKFVARPLLKFKGGGSSSVTINGRRIEIFGADGTVTYDSESEIAYSDRGMVNTNVSTNGKIEIPSGASTVTVTGSATVTMIPRWWEA